jgi:hypothetical protein
MTSSDGQKMKCSGCGKVTEVNRASVEKKEWANWRCEECETGGYGQNFVRWIEDRISPSTAGDKTGRFVLRELVQNADDAEAKILILAFERDALYVYNNGFAFRSSVDGGPGDFERISKVLAKPKEKEFYTSGNFGSGFQTVYLFTNSPEIHSSGKSFRYDPTIPKKLPVDEGRRIPSPFKGGDRLGAVFRLPWRTKENAVVKSEGIKYFEDEEIWTRWDRDRRKQLFDEFQDYVHDALICCQNLLNIRVLWHEDSSQSSYQAERDFTLKYVDFDGEIGRVSEGPGKGGLTLEEWKYEKKNDYEYLIGSDFVMDFPVDKGKIAVIFRENYETKVKGYKIERHFGNVEEYHKFLEDKHALKKSDIHILIPLFPWEERSKGYQRKSWSYSVIPLPKESGNNFTFSAHLFPKQTREAFELHQEDAKREWLEAVLRNAVRLFDRTYKRYVNLLVKSERWAKDSRTQRMLLDYLPSTVMAEWIGLSLDDQQSVARIDQDFFSRSFSQSILLAKDSRGKHKWTAIFSFNESKFGKDAYSDIVNYPRSDEERWLIEKMGYLTFSKEFLEHHRFKELDSFKKNLEDIVVMNDAEFVHMYENFPSLPSNSACRDGSGNLRYGKSPLDNEMVSRLLDYCLVNSKSTLLKGLQIIPNEEGALRKPEELRYEKRKEFASINEVIPKRLLPHHDFRKIAENYVSDIKVPIELFEGIRENHERIEQSVDLAKACYRWLDKSEMRFPDDLSSHALVLTQEGNLESPQKIYLIPLNHYDVVMNLINKVKDDTKLVSKELLKEFSDFFEKKLSVKMARYDKLVRAGREVIEGQDESHRKIQNVVVEGVLLQIEKALLDPPDLASLEFLPVDGHLKSLREACIGNVGDQETGFFLGCIDSHIQSLINENEDHVKALTASGIGNLETDLIGHAVRRINSYAEGCVSKDGLSRLDETHHHLVSEILKYVVDAGGLLTFQDVYKMRILPVSYRGDVVLSLPPRWDTVGNKKHRLEQYESDWPWAGRAEKDDIPQFWSSIRFLKLFEGYERVERELDKTFEMQKVISPDGTPRGLMMHFLLPEDDPPGGIFEKGELAKLLGRETSVDEEIAIKKRLLNRFIRIYFESSAHEDEQLESNDKHCLYDKNGIWGKPTDFAVGISEDLIDLYQPLSDDFSEEHGWTPNILKNLGVADKLEFGRIEQSVKERTTRNRNAEDDRIILQLVSKSLEKKLGTKEDWSRLSELEWVPTIEGRGKPADALVPTVGLLSICGDIELKSKLDDSSLKQRGPEYWSKFNSADIEAIGLRTRPNSLELVLTWAELQKRDSEPPKALFDSIEENLDSIKNTLKEIGVDKSKLKYFCVDGWKNATAIYIGKSDDLPRLMKNKFGFTEKNVRLIRWLRGEEGNDLAGRIGVREALCTLTDNPQKNDFDDVWTYVVKHRSEIDSKIAEEFKDRRFVLYGDRYYSPSHIIVAPRATKGLAHQGSIGDWLSLSTDRIGGEIDTLENLSARRFEDLVTEKAAVIDLTAGIAGESLKKDDKLWADLRFLIGIMVTNQWDIPRSLRVVPVNTDDGITFESPNRLLLKDDDGIWQLFLEDPRLPFFDVETLASDELAKEMIEEWLEKSGARRFGKIVARVEEPNVEDAERDEKLEARIQSVGGNLSEISNQVFERKDIELLAPSIQQLGRLMIYSIADITRKYEVKLADNGKEHVYEKKVRSDYYLDQKSEVLFLSKKVTDSQECLRRFITDDMRPPGFQDKYREFFWTQSVIRAFSPDYAQGTDFSVDFDVDIWTAKPDFNRNLEILDEWWAEHQTQETHSMPTLDGNLWWPALGLEDGGDASRRSEILREKLFKDRRLMFAIFSTATLLSTRVSRKNITDFIEIINAKGLSFSKLYEMDEADALEQLISQTLYVQTGNKTQEIHPALISRIFDILVLRRALKDNENGEAILNMIKAHMKDGLSPEEYLRSGRGYAIKPVMRGFKGLFTGQTYFIVREATRLGLTDQWKHISFHAPSQVREFLRDIGREVPPENEEGWREKLAIGLTEDISHHVNLNGWYDIPFFVYCDEFCSTCRMTSPSKECRMTCAWRP